MQRRSFLLAPAGLLFAAPGVRPGCQTNAWRINPEKFAEVLGVLDRIHALGYSGFETGFRNVQGQFDRAKEARAAMEKRGLAFIGCHIFLLDYDRQTLIAPEDLWRRVLAGAQKLGAQRLILSGGSAGSDPARRERKFAALNTASKAARASGMTLAYHNHDREFLSGEIEQLLRDTDVRLVLDAGHAYLAKADVPAFFERHSSRIDAIHLRDFKGIDQVPLGQGEFDLRPLAAAMRRRNWDGWAINEEERLNDVRPGDSAVVPARAHLRKVFGV